ncbi:MAG: universal stress protein [Angustibacter sp.]
MRSTEPPHLDPPIDGGIVVGWDGSELADRALAWAADEARRRAVPLHVVRVWVLSTAISETGAPFGTVPSMQECADTVAARTSEAVGALRADDPHGLGDLTVYPHQVHGPAAQTLLAVAVRVDLLVVGQRGRGGFAGLRLGSVAEQVVRHAPCTVVVVR